MSWRVVVISKRAKLEYKMNYLVVRDEEVTRIHLSEIRLLIVESVAVSLTVMLLTKLQERKIKIIFCDTHRNPESELVPYYGCHNSVEKIKCQIAWDVKFKELLWREIVREKIRNQAMLLVDKDKHALLHDYSKKIEEGDKTNREAHAAKVYFNSLFGSSFTRKSDDEINIALNYGYTILLSAISREVVANGYITQLGINHDNKFNHFNLSSDLIEPLRPMVDREVKSWGEFNRFTSEQKISLIELLTTKVKIRDKSFFFLDALEEYCRSVLEAMSKKDITLIKFISYGQE